MRTVCLPPVPYDATARRPDWDDLPAGLRTAIAERLGAAVVGTRVAFGGFTSGFTAVVDTADGTRAFVKAASLSAQPDLAHWYAVEAAITSALPTAVPAARPRWTATAAGHRILCLEAVDGHMPGLPWEPAELAAALDAWAAAARALADPPAGLLALGLPDLSEIVRSDLACWSLVATGSEPAPGPSLAGQSAPRTAAGPPTSPPPARDDLRRVARERLRELVDLEAALPGYVAGRGVTHLDLRVDNVIIDRAGRAWLCDWNWACHGQPWFDTAVLLITAYASGLDADALFAAHPTAVGAPTDALDASLAAISGYWLCRGGDPAPPDGAALRAHQRWSGAQALAWLAGRRGWA